MHDACMMHGKDWVVNHGKDWVVMHGKRWGSGVAAISSGEGEGVRQEGCSQGGER